MIPRHRLLLVAAPLVLAMAAAPAVARTRIRTAAVGVNDAQLPVYVAIDQGFLAHEGVELELIKFAGGGPAIQAFVGGSLDLCLCASDHVVRLNNRRVDARILVGLDRYITSTLMVRADSPYTDIVSLRGQKVGSSSPGSYSDNTLRWEITRKGLNPNRDFQIVTAGAGAAARAALESGQLAAITTPTPEVLDMERTAPHRFRILIDWRTIEHAGQVVIVRQRWVDANQAAAQAVGRAVARAQRLIVTDRDAAVRGVRRMFPERGEEYAEALADAVRGRHSPDGQVSRPGFQTMLEVLRIADPAVRPVEQEAVDLSPGLAR
jgi:NitT/TauT family transport system substrate-binding protein